HNEHETTKHAPVQPNDGNEDSKKPKKKKRFYKRKWFIFLMLLFLIILGGIIYFVLSTPKMIHMPDGVNEEYDDAKETLEENQLKVNKKMMSSEEVEEGLVIKTDPEANSSVKEKSTINVLVSEGKEKVKIEDSVGENNGKKVNKKMISSKEMEEGLVIKTDKKTNRSVKEKSTVNVFVSEGKEKVKFGDYVGENFGQTKRLLEEEGYKDVIDYPKPSDEPE